MDDSTFYKKVKNMFYIFSILYLIAQIRQFILIIIKMNNESEDHRQEYDTICINLVCGIVNGFPKPLLFAMLFSDYINMYRTKIDILFFYLISIIPFAVILFALPFILVGMCTFNLILPIVCGCSLIMYMFITDTSIIQAKQRKFLRTNKERVKYAIFAIFGYIVFESVVVLVIRVLLFSGMYLTSGHMWIVSTYRQYGDLPCHNSLFTVPNSGDEIDVEIWLLSCFL